MMNWIWQQSNNLLYLTIPKWRRSGVILGFSTRGGGISTAPFSSLNLALHVNDEPNNVLHNRNRFLTELRSEAEKSVVAEQVHGHQVAWVKAEHRGSGIHELSSALSGCDAMLTQTTLGLLSFYADCVPIFFYHPGLQIVGVAHAGWKGTAQRIVANVIEEITKAGGRSEDTLAAIGPCIQSCCYQVNEDVADFFSVSSGVVQREQDTDKYRLHLSLANKQQLLDKGVQPANLAVTDLCTACNPQLFYSYRRDNGVTGRMGAFIRLEKGV